MNLEELKQRYSRKHLAAVTGATLIVLILYFVAGVGASNAPTQKQATKVCKDRCNSIQEASGKVKKSLMYKYCKNTFKIRTSPLSGPQLKKAETEYCTDGARCANFYTCSTDSITLDMEGCKEFMTQYHRNVLGESPQTARQHTQDLLSPKNEETGVGSCNPKPEWYTSNTTGGTE